MLTVFSALFLTHTSAQLIIYKTYDEYKNKGGEKYDESYTYDHGSGSDSFGGYIVVFSNDKKDKVKITCGKIWGYSYKGMLFRITESKKVPVALLNMGKVCYYENGFAYMKTAGADSAQSVNIYLGGVSYLSKDLQSEVILIPTGYSSEGASEMKKFKKEHPETSEMVDCLAHHKHEGYGEFRNCVNMYNGSAKHQYPAPTPKH